MTYSIKYAPHSPSSEYLVIATDQNGRETFMGALWSRQAAEDRIEELKRAR